MARVCVFDVNETLLDLAALNPLFAELFGDGACRQEWFSQVLRSALLATATDRYADFGQVGGAALQMVAQRRGVTLPDDAVPTLGARIRELPVHPEVPAALDALAEAGLRLATLTNSPLATARAQLDNAELAGRFEAILSAENAGRLKPAPAPYRMAAEQLGVSVDDIRLVAAHEWDVTGAIRAGCAAAFVGRPGMVLDPLGEAPDVVGRDLTEVADAIIAAER